MNYYEILELNHSATADEIKTAYKRLARKWHPDKNKGRDTTKQFQQISEAYEVLSNPVSKQRYDNFKFSSQSQSFAKTKNHSQKASSSVNKPKSKSSEIPKPFDWKTFVWKNSDVQKKITALKAFAQEVNTRPTKGSLLPDWIEFGSEVQIRGDCKFPPDNNGPYITLELREIFGEAKAEIPVKLHSLL